jgi:hypothetical protein
MSEVEKYDLSHHLEQAVQELDADSIGLAHNMYDATLDQLHEIVAFAERLKEGALVEMYLRERQAHGVDARYLIVPPTGYAGYRTESSGQAKGNASSITVDLIDAADDELDALRRDAQRYRVLRERWLRIEDGALVHRAGGLDLWCDERLSASTDQAPKR